MPLHNTRFISLLLLNDKINAPSSNWTQKSWLIVETHLRRVEMVDKRFCMKTLVSCEAPMNVMINSLSNTWMNMLKITEPLLLLMRIQGFKEEHKFDLTAKTTINNTVEGPTEKEFTNSKRRKLYCSTEALHSHFSSEIQSPVQSFESITRPRIIFDPIFYISSNSKFVPNR